MHRKRKQIDRDTVEKEHLQDQLFFLWLSRQPVVVHCRAGLSSVPTTTQLLQSTQQAEAQCTAWSHSSSADTSPLPAGALHRAPQQLWLPESFTPVSRQRAPSHLQQAGEATCSQDRFLPLAAPDLLAVNNLSLP